MRDNPINALRETLRCGFAFRKSRLESLCVLVFGVFVARTVNLSHLACHFPGRARSSSNYRRLQRFFEQVDFDYDRLAEFLVAMMGLQAGAVAADHGPDQLAAGSPRRQHLDDRHRQPRHRHSRVLAGARQGGQFQYQGADRDPRTRPPASSGSTRSPASWPTGNSSATPGWHGCRKRPSPFTSASDPTSRSPTRVVAWSRRGSCFATSNPGKAASSPTPGASRRPENPRPGPSSSPRSISRPANC